MCAGHIYIYIHSMNAYSFVRIHIHICMYMYVDRSLHPKTCICIRIHITTRNPRKSNGKTGMEMFHCYLYTLATELVSDYRLNMTSHVKLAFVNLPMEF